MTTVDVKTEGAVRVITLDRPEARNALNRHLRLELREAFTAAAADSAPGGDVRAVVVTAAGPAFCAGQDLNEQLEDTRAAAVGGADDANDKVLTEYNPMMDALLSIPVPVIAAVQGAAAGAGWGIAMACDFRIATTAAVFKGAFSGVGLASDCGLSRSLTDAVGQTKALELLLFDERVDAEQAASLGIVTSVVMPEELEDAVATLARRFASGPTASHREIKALVRDAAAVSARAGEEAEAQLRLASSADHREAIAAFLEKRKPDFTGE